MHIHPLPLFRPLQLSGVNHDMSPLYLIVSNNLLKPNLNIHQCDKNYVKWQKPFLEEKKYILRGLYHIPSTNMEVVVWLLCDCLFGVCCWITAQLLLNRFFFRVLQPLTKRLKVFFSTSNKNIFRCQCGDLLWRSRSAQCLRSVH